MKANIFFLVVSIFFAEVKSTSDFESKVDGILKRVITLIIIAKQCLCKMHNIKK